MSVGDSFEILIREDIDGKGKTHVDFKMVKKGIGRRFYLSNIKKYVIFSHK